MGFFGLSVTIYSLCNNDIQSDSNVIIQYCVIVYNWNKTLTKWKGFLSQTCNELKYFHKIELQVRNKRFLPLNVRFLYYRIKIVSSLYVDLSC